jgi:hypothetical protein
MVSVYVLYLLNCGALVDQPVNDASHFKNCSQLVVLCVVLGLRPYSAVLYLCDGALIIAAYDAPRARSQLAMLLCIVL